MITILLSKNCKRNIKAFSDQHVILSIKIEQWHIFNYPPTTYVIEFIIIFKQSLIIHTLENKFDMLYNFYLLPKPILIKKGKNKLFPKGRYCVKITF